MTINNTTSNTFSWFCFNSLDAFKLSALASGDLDGNTSKSYTPPDNTNGFYGVRFTAKGGGLEYAMGTVSKDGRIELIGTTDGTYSVNVAKS